MEKFKKRIVGIQKGPKGNSKEGTRWRNDGSCAKMWEL